MTARFAVAGLTMALCMGAYASPDTYAQTPEDPTGTDAGDAARDDGEVPDGGAVYATSLPGKVVVWAEAGEDQTLFLEGGLCTGDALLDGSGSGPADSIVSYLWSEGGVLLAEGPWVSVALSPGVHEIVLKVVDDLGQADFDGVVVTVIDMQEPALTCEMVPFCPASGSPHTVCHRGKTLHLGSGSAALAHVAHGDAAGPCDGDHQVAEGHALVCHHGRTLEVAAEAVPRHVQHGDYVGPCGAGCGEGEQLLRASWSLSPTCDASWEAAGSVNGVPVGEGQLVDWTQTLDGSSGAFVGEVLDIDAPRLALQVQAVNADGLTIACRWYPDAVVAECAEQQQGAIDACLEGCVAPPPPLECAVCDGLNQQILEQCLMMGLSPDACDALHAALGAACADVFCVAPPAECGAGCVLLGERAQALCELDPGAFDPVSCVDGGQIVTQLCQAQICATEPSCEDVCMQQADAARELCLASGEAPEDCDWRWQDIYATCVQTQCQPPVPCEQTCFDELQSEVMGCILGEADAPECEILRSCLEPCGGCPSACNVDAVRAYAPCIVGGLDPVECEPAVTAAYDACVADCGATPECWPECVDGDGWCPASCSVACDADCAFDPCDPVACAPGDGVCNPQCDPQCDVDCQPMDPCDPLRCAPGDGVCGEGCDPACDADCQTADPCDPIRCMPGDGVCGEGCDPACDEDCMAPYCDPTLCFSGDGMCFEGCDSTCDSDCAGPITCDPEVCIPGDGVCDASCDPACDPDCGMTWCDPWLCLPGDGVCDRSMCDETCDDDCMIAWCDPQLCLPGDGVCDLAWCDTTCDPDCGVGHCEPAMCVSDDGVCDLVWCDESCDTDCRIAWCDPAVCVPGDGMCDYVWCDESCDPDCGVVFCDPAVCVPGDGQCDLATCGPECDPDCEVPYCDPAVCLPGDGVCDASMCGPECDPDCGTAWCDPAVCVAGDGACDPAMCDATCDPDCAGGECPAQCQQTVAPVQQLCYGLVGDPAICDPIADLAIQACVGVVCSGQAPACEGGCAAFASQVLDACEPLFDPALCDLGFTALTDSCVQVFGCGAPPTCEQQCQVAAEEARMACEAQGLDPAECDQIWEAVFEPCLAACSPQDPECADQCQADGEALFLQCVTPEPIDL